MVLLVQLLPIITLALSIFNLVAFLWLAFTVWLNGNRRSMITHVGMIGLSLSAFFFFLHALLISKPFPVSASFVSLDFLWHLIWLPALGVPYIWFVIGLYYASLISDKWRRRRPLLLIYAGILGCSVFLLLLLNQATFTFASTIDTFYRPPRLLFPLVLLPILFLCYVMLCTIGPWFTPGRAVRLMHVLWYVCIGRKGKTSLHRLLADAFWNDPMRVEQLEEPTLSWYLARPGLLLAALLMVGLTITLGVLGVWSMLNWLWQGTRPLVSLPVTLDTFPLNLTLLDMFATGLVALIILLIGYSVVRHGILIERPLARHGFFEQWRGIVIVAATIAVLIALLVTFTHSNLGGLLLITSLATGTYALFTWSSYTAHDRYIALLGPFLRSTNMRHWLNTDLQKTEQSMENLFFHLCKDVLEVKCAYLLVRIGSIRRHFSYCWPISDEGSTPTMLPRQCSTSTAPIRVRMRLDGQPIISWVLPIYDELGPVATLYLGPRQDGSIFTDEDMDLAHACGQRILDTLRDHEAMQAVADLLRRRIVDVKLLGAQHRRVLHDEILPQIHLALLRLETLRSSLESEHVPNTQPIAALEESVQIISDTHRRLATMMRAITPSAPHRLERDGMMHAIHRMIDTDFQQAFDEVEWAVSEETARSIDELVPPALAELIFAAVQEVLHNSARHARGSDVHRRLCLIVKASCNPHLEVIVADDGIGIAAASSSTTGTGAGLLTHSALLAIAGGSLTVKSTPGHGVTIRIFLSAESLR